MLWRETMINGGYNNRYLGSECGATLVEGDGGRMVAEETTTMDVENERELSCGRRWWRVWEEDVNGGVCGCV